MIILIAGIPASGKTTISRKLCCNMANIYKNVYHIEIDDIRSMCVSEKTHKELGSDWLEIIGNILLFLTKKDNKLIVIEGLFFEKESIDYINEIISVDFYLKIVSDLSICLERNKLRLQKDEILPENEIINLNKYLETPSFFIEVSNNFDLDKTLETICKIIGILL